MQQTSNPAQHGEINRSELVGTGFIWIEQDIAAAKHGEIIKQSCKGW